MSQTSSKTTNMLVKSPRINHALRTIIELLETVESLRYLGLKIPSRYRWKECATYHLETGKRAYRNGGEIKGLVFSKHISHALATLVLPIQGRP